MSNENDDATQLGSIGRHMSKPQQPGNPQARPAFQAPSLPTHPQEQDGDEEARYSARITLPTTPPTRSTPTRRARYSARITQLLSGRRGLRFQWRSPCSATDAIRSNTTAATTIAIGSRNGNAPIPADYGTKRQARAAGHGFFHDVRAAGRHHRIP